MGNNTQLVPRIKIVNLMLNILEQHWEQLENGRSVACLDFTDVVGNGGCCLTPRQEVIYRIGVNDLPKNVDAETAALALSSAIHESEHEHQILHKIGDGNHERMLVDWMATTFNPMFYNATLHYNSFEAKAYRAGIVKTRPIMVNLFGKNGETALLKTYMDRARNFDTVYFTHEKRYDYKDINEYIHDMDRYIDSLDKARPAINARKLYKPNSRIINTNTHVKDCTIDKWGRYINRCKNIDNTHFEVFCKACDEYEQAKLVSSFVRKMHPEIKYVLPVVDDLEFHIKFFNQTIP